MASAFWRLPERAGRLAGMALFGFMVARQFYYFSAGASWISHLRWFLVTALFMLFFAAYVRRGPARELAQGPVEILLPFFCAGLPFVVTLGADFLNTILALPDDYQLAIMRLFVLRRLGFGEPLSGLGVMALGEAITVAGMLSLGRSFSITTETRELRRHGLYRFMRHPLYSGEILSLFGYALAYPCSWTFWGALLFALLQGWRAKMEEAKLLRHFPEYAAYRREAGFLLPRLVRGKTE